MNELNEGLRKFWSGDLSGAAEALHRALSGGAQAAAIPLGEALLALGRNDEARRAFAAGDGPRAKAGEGRALLALGQAADAAAALREAALLAPDADGLLALAEAEAAARDLPAAIAAAERALRLAPEDPAAERLVRELRGRLDPQADRASPDYVRTLFDQYAPRFDQDLATLGYRAPALLFDAVRALRPDAAGLAILDLGCGTGLAGQAFRPLARRLEGQDLSPRMLVQAEKRQVYDRLEEGDLLTPLNRDPAAWDLILAADVLVYLGDLHPVFAGAAQALKPGGLLAFTVEGSPDEGWALGPRGRFLHGESYLREGAQAAGLAVAHLARAELRRERGDPVGGFVTVLERVV